MDWYEFLAYFVGSLVWSAIIAKFLQLAFKIVVGQANAYRDSFRICFIASFIHLLFSAVLPSIVGGTFGFEIIGPFLVIGITTFLIAKEIGDLMKSFVIALVLEGITFLVMLGLMLIVVAIAVGSSAV